MVLCGSAPAKDPMKHCCAGTVPPDFGNASGLYSFNIGGNQLTGMPTSRLALRPLAASSAMHHQLDSTANAMLSVLRTDRRAALRRLASCLARALLAHDAAYCRWCPMQRCSERGFYSAARDWEYMLIVAYLLPFSVQACMPPACRQQCISII